jgi:hypothetical protein
MGMSSGQPSAGRSPVSAMYFDALQQAFAEVKSRGAQLQPRHHEWFSGKPLVVDSADNLERMVAKAMAEKIVARMKVMGTACYGSFAEKMARFPHRMEKSLAAGLIPGHVTHGVCRLGQVVDVNERSLDVVRFFVTNGDVEIDPAMGNRYLRLKDRQTDRRMFYGVALKLDRDGRFLRMDTDRFDDGVAFLTDNPQEALFNMSAVSTGRSVELFRSMATASSPPAPSGVIQPALRQPRF